MAKFYRFNYKGDLIVEKTFDELVTISNKFTEYSRVRKGNKWGVVDTKTLDIFVDFKYDRLSLGSSFDNSVVFIGWLDEKTYLIDISDKNLTPDSYDKLYFEENTDFAVSKKNNLSGIVSIKNKIIFDTEYTSCKIVLQNIFLLQKNEIFYLGNDKGEILNKIECQEVVPNVFFIDNNWELNYFTYNSNGKFGLLDSNFDIIIPANYESLTINKFNKIYGQLNQVEYELDNKADILKQIDYTLNFSTTSDVIKIGENNYNYIISQDNSYGAKRGILDNDYKLVLPIEYDWIEYTYDVWKVRKGRSEYLLDENYILIPNSKYKRIGKFEEEGIACVQDEELKYKFINKSGEVLLNKSFDAIQLDSRSSLDFLFKNIKTRHISGLCGVCINSKWGYIDLTGKIKIGFKYDKITEFDHRGHAIVQYDSKWGLIDQDDRIIIDFKFEHIFDYNDDLELIISKKDDFFGMVDFNNIELIPFTLNDLNFSKTELIFGYSKKPIAKKPPVQKPIEPINLLESKLLEKHNNLLHDDLLRVMIMAVVSGDKDDLSNRLYLIDVVKKDLTTATFISGYAGGGTWGAYDFVNGKEYTGEEGWFSVFDYIRDDDNIKNLVSGYVCEIDKDLDEYQYKSLKHFNKVEKDDLNLLYSVWYNDDFDYTDISKNDKKRFKNLLKQCDGIYWQKWNFKF